MIHMTHKSLAADMILRAILLSLFDIGIGVSVGLSSSRLNGAAAFLVLCVLSGGCFVFILVILKGRKSTVSKGVAEELQTLITEDPRETFVLIPIWLVFNLIRGLSISGHLILRLLSFGKIRAKAACLSMESGPCPWTGPWFVNNVLGITGFIIGALFWAGMLLLTFRLLAGKGS